VAVEERAQRRHVAQAGHIRRAAQPRRALDEPVQHQRAEPAVERHAGGREKA
jgi:hypothetical protein